MATAEEMTEVRFRWPTAIHAISGGACAAVVGRVAQSGHAQYGRQWHFRQRPPRVQLQPAPRTHRVDEHAAGYDVFGDGIRAVESTPTPHGDLAPRPLAHESALVVENAHVGVGDRLTSGRPTPDVPVQLRHRPVRLGAELRHVAVVGDNEEPPVAEHGACDEHVGRVVSGQHCQGRVPVHQHPARHADSRQPLQPMEHRTPP